MEHIGRKLSLKSIYKETLSSDYPNIYTEFAYWVEIVVCSRFTINILNYDGCFSATEICRENEILKMFYLAKYVSLCDEVKYVVLYNVT